MKKVLTVIAVLALISTASFAQTKFGVKAGLNIANQSYSSEGISVSPSARTGVVVGGFANFSIVEEKFAIQPELLFAMQGSTLDSGFGDMDMKLNYLTVPVVAKYYFGGFNLQAGPQLGFLLSAKDEEDDDIKDELKGIDFGTTFGVGYDFDFGLTLDTRYMVGLSDIIDSNDTDVEVKNNAFQITVGWRF